MWIQILLQFKHERVQQKIIRKVFVTVGASTYYLYPNCNRGRRFSPPDFGELCLLGQGIF